MWGGSVTLTPLTFLVDARPSAIPFTNLGRIPTTVCYLPFHPVTPPIGPFNKLISQQVQQDKTIKQRTANVIDEHNAFLIAAIYSLIRHNTVHKGFEVHISPTGKSIEATLSFDEEFPLLKSYLIMQIKITSNKGCVGT